MYYDSFLFCIDVGEFAAIVGRNADDALIFPIRIRGFVACRPSVKVLLQVNMINKSTNLFCCDVGFELHFLMELDWI
jgi:hypothetical protein